MTTQNSLFSAANLASTVQMPPAPKHLTPHTDWPYPGMTPEDSARSVVHLSEEYQEMLAAVIKSKGGARMTREEILAAIPADWRDLCGKYASASIWNWAAKKHGVEITYVTHDGGGGHFEYHAVGAA